MSTSAILPPGSTDAQLEQAVMKNHAALFAKNATASGGVVRVDGGLMYTLDRPGGKAMVTFHGKEIGKEELDDMMSFYRSHKPSGIGYWCLHPAEPTGIGARLLARGFQDGWRPCWMALALEGLVRGHVQPAGLEIKRDANEDVAEVKGLPYWGKDSAVSDALTKVHPDLAHKFVAYLDGRIVGHCAIFLSEGVAGFYSMGVLHRYRQRGIGKALVTEACLYARSLGYHHAVLNGTGRRMYEQVGFRWIGDGHTWWVVNRDVFSLEPDPVQVALAEAVGLGDINTLDRIWADSGGFDLNKPLLNKHSLIDLAVSCRQSAGAGWLVQHGVPVGVLQAWDLGWKDRAAAMLKEDSSLVNQRVGDRGETVLHIAVERGDTPLARLALSARPDLSIKDSAFNNDALGWARFLGRFEIARLIEAQ